MTWIIYVLMGFYRRIGIYIPHFLPNGTLAAEASGLIQNDNQDNTTINKVGA